MRKIRLSRHVRVSFIKSAILVILLNILFIPPFVKYEPDGDNLFVLYLNGEEVGTVGSLDRVNEIIADARRAVGRDSDSIVYLESDLSYDAGRALFAKVDSERTVRDNMARVMRSDAYEVLQSCYTMRIGDITVNLPDSDSVREVLQAALDAYDTKGQYKAELVVDPNRELNALTVSVVTDEEAKEKAGQAPVWNAGIAAVISEAMEAEDETEDDGLSFDDYEYGITDMVFDDNIEIVESYLTEDQLSTVDEAIEEVVSFKEVNTIYEVQDGDTLSEIAMKTQIPMEKIVELNENLEDTNSMIRSGDELVVTTTAPPITVERVERQYIEEYYDAEIQYVDNDEWYTYEQVTLQQPSCGRRNIVADITYENDKEIGREIVKEEVLVEAVPKIVERGTKIPPTYIKPLSGGRLSSGFGGRKAPTKGASTNHKGIDWATPIGTAIYASSGGTVTKAGWGSGYGYVIYIKHPDGRETRYGHLSKVLVSPGQSVKQGQKIALSGNTGRSTGPHLHFEIRINGVAVNPLKYLN